MSADLTGRRAIITDAATGCGSETATYFLAAGVSVLALDTHEQASLSAAWTRVVSHQGEKCNVRANALTSMAYTPMVDVARDLVSEEQKSGFDQRILLASRTRTTSPARHCRPTVLR